jgi:hypothetical protein
MTTTSIIINKNGRDSIRRNPLVKNKNCTKILNIVDDKGIPLFTNFNRGTPKKDETFFWLAYLRDRVLCMIANV